MLTAYLLQFTAKQMDFNKVLVQCGKDGPDYAIGN
jgi:hypothetical protein